MIPKCKAPSSATQKQPVDTRTRAEVQGIECVSGLSYSLTLAYRLATGTFWDQTGWVAAWLFGGVGGSPFKVGSELELLVKGLSTWPLHDVVQLDVQSQNVLRIPPVFTVLVA